MKIRVITVQGSEVTVTTRHEQGYVSLTGMVRNFDGTSALIEQWLKNKDTVLFLKWIDATGAFGLRARAGRYGGINPAKHRV